MAWHKGQQSEEEVALVEVVVAVDLPEKRREDSTVVVPTPEGFIFCVKILQVENKNQGRIDHI